MPQDGLFFRVLRRFNLLLGALAGLAFLALCGWGGWETWKREQQTHGLYNFRGELLAPATAIYDVQLGPLEGTSGIVVPGPLSPASTYNDLYLLNRETPLTKYATQPVVTNLMLADKQKGTGTWLFKGTNRTILARFGIREGKLNVGAAVDDRPIVGLVLLVDDKDPNPDGLLAPDVDMSVYYWRLDKSDAVKVLEAVKYVSNGPQGTCYNIVYKKGGKTVSVIYSIPDFKVISETTLPEP